MTSDVVAAGPDQTAAARVLWAISRGELIDGPVPAELRAYDDAPAQAGLPLQLEVLDLWQQAGEQVGGWKIAWTSRGARDRGGKNFRPFGYILASRIHSSGAVLDRSAVPNGVVEAEICLTIGQRLTGADVTSARARAAVAAVAPAFEICSQRLPKGVSIPCRIGNGMNNWGLVVGREQSTDLALDNLSVHLLRDGQQEAAGGSGPDVLDDPYLSLARVAAELHRYGLALEPGERVITGSVLPSTSIDAATQFEARFGELGAVRVEFP